MLTHRGLPLTYRRQSGQRAFPGAPNLALFETQVLTVAQTYIIALHCSA